MNDDTQGQTGGVQPVNPVGQGTPATPQPQQPAQPAAPAPVPEPAAPTPLPVQPDPVQPPAAPPTPPTPPAQPTPGPAAPTPPPAQPAAPGVGTPPPPPTGGTPPPAGQPPVAGAAQPGAGTPPPPPKDEKPANFQLGTMLGEKITLTLQAHPDTKFDDTFFVRLLAGSISLSKAEKVRIIEAIPKLKQWQVDELVNIFEEEKKKFAQLSERHVPQLKKLEKQHFEEWQDIEMEQKQSGKVEEDKEKADEIRKNLGL